MRTRSGLDSGGVSCQQSRMTRRVGLLIIVVLWAGIYLPGLGSLEIKGEEGRRILPAIHMLESGDWVVPHVGGKPYLRKPPLASWAVAGAFQLMGTRSEWAARLPSVLAVLAMGLAILCCSHAWLGTRGAVLAAIFALTNISMIEKGRLIEIEALYISLTGIAMVFWLGLWIARRSPWIIWPGAMFFLGLGLLAKGPLHLLYFYAVVMAVIGYSRRLRDLLHPAHFVGLLLMLAMFAAWALPFLQQAPEGTLDAWKAQFTGRLGGGEFNLGKWLLVMPRGLINYLPWLIFVPLWWKRDFIGRLSTEDAAVARGLRLAVCVGFVAVSLLPGSVPRYTLPLLTPASLLLALALSQQPCSCPQWTPIVWRWIIKFLAGAAVLAGLVVLFRGITGLLPGFGALDTGSRDPIAVGAGILVIAISLFLLLKMERTDDTVRLSVATGAVGLAIMLAYAGGAVTVLQLHHNVRPVAERIEAQMPEGKRLCALAPGFQPFLVYLRPGLLYTLDPRKIPREADYVLTPVRYLERLRQRFKDGALMSDTEVMDKDGKSYLLLEIEWPPEA